MAFAYPRANGGAMVWDQASSMMARGENLHCHARRSSASRRRGGSTRTAIQRPTRRRFLGRGRKLPFGGYKGRRDRVDGRPDVRASDRRSLFGRGRAEKTTAMAVLQPVAKLILAFDPRKVRRRRCHRNGASDCSLQCWSRMACGCPAHAGWRRGSTHRKTGFEIPKTLHDTIRELCTG